MEIWLDTSDLELVQLADEMGILHGVTTNPSIVAKAKIGFEPLLQSLLKLQKGPVTAQVTAQEAKEMASQGKALHEFSSRIIVKVPVTKEGLKAIRILKLEGISVMATTVFDLNQVVLAARAGADYIAPYFSSICESDIAGFESFQSMLRFLQRYEYPAKLLAASLKSAEHVKQIAEIGADAVTLNKEVFSSLIDNNLETMKRIDRFAQDWAKAPIQPTLFS